MKNRIILELDTHDSRITIVRLIIDKKTIERKIKINQSFQSQILLPLIEQILANNKVRLSDLNEIIVNQGPGSFTGLRVGVSIANILGWGLSIKVNDKFRNIVVPIYE